MRIILKPGGLGIVLAMLLFAIVSPFVVLRLSARNKPAVSVPPSATSSVRVAANAGASASKASGPNLIQDANWKFYTESDARATSTTLSGKDAPATPAYRFDVQHIGGQQWNIGFNNKLQGVDIAANQTMRVRFWARSATSSKICLIMQKDAPPFPHAWKEYVQLTPEWKQYTRTFQSAAYAKGEGIFAIFLGFDAGTIDLAGIELERAE